MVEHWFQGFARHLQGSLKRTDWPDRREPFWVHMKSALVRCGATEDVANEAVGMLVESPPPFLDRVIPGLIESIKQVHESRRGMIGDVPTDRAAAEAQSRDCPECAGSGWATRYCRNRTRFGRVVVERAAFLCHRCAAGRWFARYYAENPPKDGIRPFVDLADHPQLQPEEYRDAPDPAWVEEEEAATR